MFSCSITKGIAVFYKLALYALFVYCFIAVPYPYCYYLVREEEDAREIRLYFEKNDFFRECSKTTNKLLKTEKDVAVYTDGKEFKRIRNKELCGKEP